MPSSCQEQEDSVFDKGWVSVIIPTYNRASLLAEALESVRKQTYRPIEIVVVDDGSTDDTETVVRDFIEHVKADENLKVVFLYQERGGAQAARNLGALKARGEYIQFLDSDDLLLPQKTEWGVNGLQDPDVDLIYFRTLQVGMDLKPNGKPPLGKPLSGSAYDITYYPWHTSGPLYRRRLVERVGPWLETLQNQHDWEYSARVQLTSPCVAYDSRIASYFRSHDGKRISYSTPKQVSLRSYELAIDNLLLTAKKLGLDSRILWIKLQRRYLRVAISCRKVGDMKGCWRSLQNLLNVPAGYNLAWFIAWVCLGLKNTFLLKVVERILFFGHKLRVLAAGFKSLGYRKS